MKLKRPGKIRSLQFLIITKVWTLKPANVENAFQFCISTNFSKKIHIVVYNQETPRNRYDSLLSLDKYNFKPFHFKLSAWLPYL